MMITDEDRYVFMYGGCWRLANALHEKTGWQRVATQPYLDHVFVRTPDGGYLDIEGKHTAEEMWRRWRRYCEPWASSFQEIPATDTLQRPSWRRPDYDGEDAMRAEELVPELLALAA